MNVIWDKLKELKPKYWIHMEDDFLFFEKMKYILRKELGIWYDCCASFPLKVVQIFPENNGYVI